MGIYDCVATVDDTHKLWRNIEPHLRKCLHSVYLREVTGFDVYCTLLCFFNGFSLSLLYSYIIWYYQVDEGFGKLVLTVIMFIHHVNLIW